jgi:MerR family redox-sensitive transcriptional activator SoxR
MTISGLAKQAGLRPSAIRYYESIGLLAPPPRRNGQRSYDARALRRLAVIRRAQDAGFTLDEARVVVQSPDALAQEWNRVAARKLEELDAQIGKLRAMQDLIRRMQRSCTCRDADQCGQRMLSSTNPCS